MMRTQCLLGLRTFVAFAAKLWSFFIYLLRRQIRTVSRGGRWWWWWWWWEPMSAVLTGFRKVSGLCLGFGTESWRRLFPLENWGILSWAWGFGMGTGETLVVESRWGG